MSQLLIEVETQSSTVAGESKSDLLVATLDWNTLIPVNESMSWHVGLLWEQDVREDDPLDHSEWHMARVGMDGGPILSTGGSI